MRFFLACLLIITTTGYAQSPPLGTSIGWSPTEGILTEATGSISLSQTYAPGPEVQTEIFQRIGVLYGDKHEIEAFKTMTFRESRIWRWMSFALGTGSVIQGKDGDNPIWVVFASEIGLHPINTKLRLAIGGERIMRDGGDGTFAYLRIDFKP